jgi:hypothetical protein
MWLVWLPGHHLWEGKLPDYTGRAPRAACTIENREDLLLVACIIDERYCRLSRRNNYREVECLESSVGQIDLP